MAPGYRVPTNVELAAAAETIVVAVVEGERPGLRPYDGAVVARPVLTIKGVNASSPIIIEGAALEETAGRRATRSDPRELHEANPDALMGGCVRYIFAKGMRLVLFLKRNDEGALVPYRSSFSRDAEDVPADDSLWVRAVREYAAIGALSRAERKERLTARMAELTALGDADSLALAKDMQRERSGKRLSPYD
jgi:hypothetical protein